MIVLSAWKTHFEQLGSSKIHDNPLLRQLHDSLPSLTTLSHLNEDSTLDVAIQMKEAIRKLRSRKADGVLTEHVLYGGELLKVWLKRIFNIIIKLECIPKCLKLGVVKPLYKGKGKGSFIGITITSTIAKLFEYILLNRFKNILQESGHPLLNQTAYQKGVSCEEAVFATQEAIRVLLQQDGHAFLALYDLEKAFDSVEVPVLFDCLFRAGINGKGWRLLRSWYEDVCAVVTIKGASSPMFHLNRGVRQGSVLSPILFLVLMDDLLRSLEANKAGVSIEGLYLGGACHADDIPC